MSYVYAAMWFIIGFMLIFRFGKEERIFYVAGGFFLFMGAWWLVDELIVTDLFANPWIWIFRGAVVIELAVLALMYFIGRKKRQKAASSGGDDKDK